MEDWRWLGENKHADCGGKAKWGEEERRTKKKVEKRNRNGKKDSGTEKRETGERT